MNPPLPPRSPATPALPPAWRRLLRWISFETPIGIVPRLTIAFAAVAILAVVANDVSEHGGDLIRTIERDYAESPAENGHPEADALPASLELLQRSALARAELDESGRATRYAEALVAFGSARVAYQAALTPTLDAAALTELDAASAAHATLAADLVRASDSRRRLVREVAAELASLDLRIGALLDRTLKAFGQVGSREYLVEAGRLLDDMERQIGTLAVPQAQRANAARALARNEAALAAILRDNEQSFVRLEGRDWLVRMQKDLGRVVRLRQLLARIDGEQAARIEEFGASFGALSAQIRRATARFETARAIASARRRSDDALSEISQQEERQRTLIAWLSVCILLLLLATSINTVISVVRPVRRLLSATKRMAAGALDVSVPRGGIKELDQLAVSFNHMSEQLAAANALARQYHNQLEAKVEERTRQLQHLAEHDPLTLLPNRRQLLAHLEKALQAAGTRRERVGVLFLDLDHFKYVNDSMGHVFGDRVLQAIAERLQGAVASIGFSARLGGDEFTVVHERANSPAEIQEAAQALVRAFQEPLVVDGRELLMGLSVGVSIYPEHGTEPETLLRAADAALFRAKASGRSQLSIFSHDLLEAAASKFATEQGLRRAIERGEFELFYQPEVDFTTHEAAVAESILRWRLPNGSHAYPKDFLPVAEDCGLIREIGDWVLRTAVAQAARWHRAEWPAVRVAINVSAMQLLDKRFVDSVQELLTRHALPPFCLEFELTENVLQTGRHTIESLRQLRAIGVGVALDDFGNGYSSLASLEQLPLTRVKLDRSLIASIDTSTRSQAIATAIISLCHSLGLEITAEGVENRAQFAWLRAKPAMFMQGYLLSRPLPADHLIAAIAGMPARMQLLLQDPPSAVADERLSVLRRIR